MAVQTREEFKAQMGLDEDFLFVNAAPHPFPGAVQIPLDQVQELAPTLLADRQSQIIVYEGG